MLQGSSCVTPGNEENRFERFSQLLHFVWLSYGKFYFDVRKVVVVQQGGRLRWCWDCACCRSSSIRRTCLLHDDEAVGNALFQKPMHIAFTEWFVPPSMNSPFPCSKTAKLREPPVQTGYLSPSLFDSSVTVTFGLQLFVFVLDFPLERSFSLCFSLAIGSSYYFFRAEFAGPTKN